MKKNKRNTITVKKADVQEIITELKNEKGPWCKVCGHDLTKHNGQSFCIDEEDDNCNQCYGR